MCHNFHIISQKIIFSKLHFTSNCPSISLHHIYSYLTHWPDFLFLHLTSSPAAFRRKITMTYRRAHRRTDLILPISMQIFGPCSCVRSLSITLNQILNGASQVIILFPIFFALFAGPDRPIGFKETRTGYKDLRGKEMKRSMYIRIFT